MDALRALLRRARTHENDVCRCAAVLLTIAAVGGPAVASPQTLLHAGSGGVSRADR